MAPQHLLALHWKRARVRLVRALLKRLPAPTAKRAADLLLPGASIRRAARERERFESQRFLHVLDPRLFDGSGHFLNMNLAVKDEIASRAGWRSLFYGRLDLAAEVEATLPVHPFFVKGARFRPSEGGALTKDFDPDAAARTLLEQKSRRWTEFNRQRLDALGRRAIRRSDVVLVHTLASGTQSLPAALARWIASLPPERTPRFVFGLILPHYIGPAGTPLQRDFEELFEVLGGLPEDRVLIFAETSEMRDDVAERTGGRFEIALGPHLVPNALIAEHAARRAEAPSNASPRVGFAGQARLDRGADLVVPTLHQLAAERLEARFRVHVHESSGGCIDLAALHALPGLELRVGTLDPEQYYDFVSGIDVMLLPFRPGVRTQLQGSGVFFECLALGQVMVLPQGSHFEAEARRLDAGYTAFVSNEPADIAKATLRAVEGLGDLSSRARRASERFRKEREPAHFFDRALALPRPAES